MKTKTLAIILVLIMSVTCLVPPAAATGTETADMESVVKTDDVAAAQGSTADQGEEVTIMVQLEGETAFMQTGDIQMTADNYDNQAAVVQAESSIEISLNVAIEIDESYSLLFNGFSFTGEEWMVDAIKPALEVFNGVPGIVFKVITGIVFVIVAWYFVKVNAENRKKEKAKELAREKAREAARAKARAEIEAEEKEGQ